MSLTHRFEIAGHEGYITVGLYEDGQPGELFITMSKEGSAIGGLMDTVGTLTSICATIWRSVQRLVKKFAYQRFEPSGFTKNPDIRTRPASPITFSAGSVASSSRVTRKRLREPWPKRAADEENPEMEKKALNRPFRFAADSGEGINRRNHQPYAERRHSSRGEQWSYPRGEGAGSARQHVHGHPCSHCGSDKVMRTGACGVCTECGTSQGCS